jgi:hypothetical protein
MSDPRAVIVKKALTDSSFKQSLIADPKSATEKALGVKVPGGVTVKVLEDTATLVHLVLPHLLPPTRELDDAALAKVSGGAYAYPGAATQGYQCGNSSSGGPICVI